MRYLEIGSLSSLLLCAALALGCSAEAKAEKVLEKYVTVFKMCKDMSDKAKMDPGKHRCSLVSSMALDGSLEDTGLDAAKRKTMVAAWLDESGFKGYYLGPDHPERVKHQ